MSQNPVPMVFLPPPSGDATGATDDAALAAAIARGVGIIWAQRGRYFFATPFTLPNYTIIRGQGGISAGAVTGTMFQYVGANAPSFITLGGFGSQIQDIFVLCGASFTGHVIDLNPNISTLSNIERCVIWATDTTAAVLIYADASLDTTIYKNNLVGGRYGIQANVAAGVGHYANGYTVLGNRIGGQGAAGGCIYGMGGGWHVSGNIFELQNGQAAFRSGLNPAVGCNIAGNWTGDAAAGTTVMEMFGNGLHIAGNFIGGNAGTGIIFTGASDGVLIEGNRFDTHTLGMDKNGQVVPAVIGPNSYFNVTTHHNFTAGGTRYIEP